MTEPVIDGAPATGVPPAAPAPAPTPTTGAPPAPAADIVMTSAALGERLQRAQDATRADVLKELGIEDLNVARAAIKAEADRVEAQKTLEQNVADLKATNETNQATLKSLQETVATRAAHEMTGLTKEQRAAVTVVAGDDTQRQLQVITALRPTWLTTAPDAAPPPGTAPAVVPATTGNNAPAPAPTGATAPTNHAAVYEQMRKDPARAYKSAQYLRQYSREIYDTK